MRFATRIFNDDYEEKVNDINKLSSHYGLEEIKDRGRVLFFLFNSRRQANDFAEEVLETLKISTKVIEWF